MILSFGDKPTEDLYHGIDSKDSRKIPTVIHSAALRKLDMINAAHELLDLMSPPSNRLEKLKGDRQGQYSIRINDQFRIVFDWHDGSAQNVSFVDYQ